MTTPSRSAGDVGGPERVSEYLRECPQGAVAAGAEECSESLKWSRSPRPRNRRARGVEIRTAVPSPPGHEPVRSRCCLGPGDLEARSMANRSDALVRPPPRSSLFAERQPSSGHMKTPTELPPMLMGTQSAEQCRPEGWDSIEPPVSGTHAPPLDAAGSRRGHDPATVVRLRRTDEMPRKWALLESASRARIACPEQPYSASPRDRDGCLPFDISNAVCRLALERDPSCEVD